MTGTRAAVLALVVCVGAPAGAQEAAPAGGQGTVSGAGLTLAQAVALALAREPASRAALADVAVARGMRLQAGLRANPTVSFDRRREPGGTDATSEVAIEWPLELFRRDARVGVADAELQVAEHEEMDVRRRLAADAAAGYGDVAAAVRVLAVADDVLAAASTQLELLRARVEQGVTPALDRDMVDVDVRRLRAERELHAGQVDRAMIRFKRLLGLPPDAPVSLAQSLEELSTAPPWGLPSGGSLPPTGPPSGGPIPPTWGPPSGGPTSPRPDLRASEARVKAAEERVSAARREGRPDVTLFGSYMRMDAGFPQKGFTEAGALERVRGQFSYLSAGAMVMVPLWNRQQGTLAAATSARDAAEARAESARLTVASEIAEARVRYDQAVRAVTLYRDDVRPLARRNLDTVRETYTLGRATVFDVLAEQRRYLETERAYTEALTEAYSAHVSLWRAAGEIR
jgi:cobalt-zinc-cadmium efflux system outer membrane protein